MQFILCIGNPYDDYEERWHIFQDTSYVPNNRSGFYASFICIVSYYKTAGKTD